MDMGRTARIWALLGTSFLVFGVYCATATGGVWYLIVAALLLIVGGLGGIWSAVQMMRRPDQQR